MRRARSAGLAAAFVALLSCSDSDSPSPAPALELLVRKDVEPAGANCATGGAAVRAGLDADRDGLLDDAEVAKVEYACDAAPAAVLVATSPEPAGASCANGGTRVQAGSDEDRDGVLDAPEVAETSYVCAPAQEPPAPVLTRIEAAGGGCPLAGSAVAAGADADGDGTLSDAEVTTRRYVCSSDVTWGYTIRTQADVDLLFGVTTVRGDVIVESPTLESVTVSPEVVTGSIIVRNSPRLATVYVDVALLGGSVVVRENPALEMLLLPADWPLADFVVPGWIVIERNAALRHTLGLDGVREIGGTLRIADNAALDWISLKGLERIGGQLEIARNPLLLHMANDRRLTLRTIDGFLWIHDQPDLRLEFYDLVTVGGIRVDANDVVDVSFWNLLAVLGSVQVMDNRVAFLSAQQLIIVTGDLRFERNAESAALGLRTLDRIDGDVWFADNPRLLDLGLDSLRTARQLYVYRNAALTGIPREPWPRSLSRLERLSSLHLSENAALAHLDLPALSWIEGISAYANPRLPTCEVAAVGTQAGARWIHTVGNDDLATCP